MAIYDYQYLMESAETKERKDILQQAKKIVGEFLKKEGIKLNAEGNLGTFLQNRKYNKEEVNYFEIGLGRIIADGLFSAAMGAVYLDGVSGKEYPKVKELLKDLGKRKELEQALESKIEGYSFKIGAYNDQRTSVRVHVKKK